MTKIVAAERFPAKHLRGHYQETMTPEVTKRLDEINIDLTTVVIAK